MKDKKVIPIFFATDDNYVPYMIVTIKSIIANCDKNYDYKIHVLNTGLKQSNIDCVKKVETDFLKIEFNNISKQIKEIKSSLDETLRDYYSDAIFYRIFIPQLFKQYDRAIYLDCDLVVVDDIAKMFNMDMKKNYIASVLDEVAPSAQILIDYVEKAVGVPVDKYICSGVLLMDLKALRKIKIEKKFIGLLKRYNFRTVAPDQDYINVICKNKILYLDQGWDKQSNDVKFDGELHIIHYNMFRKPWRYFDVPYEEYFWEIAKETPFYQNMLKMRETYTEEQKLNDIKGAEGLGMKAADILKDPITFNSVLGTVSVKKALLKPRSRRFHAERIYPTVWLSAAHIVKTSKELNKMNKNQGEENLWEESIQTIKTR